MFWECLLEEQKKLLKFPFNVCGLEEYSCDINLTLAHPLYCPSLTLEEMYRTFSPTLQGIICLCNESLACMNTELSERYFWTPHCDIARQKKLLVPLNFGTRPWLHNAAAVITCLLLSRAAITWTNKNLHMWSPSCWGNLISYCLLHTCMCKVWHDEIPLRHGPLLWY